MFHWYQEEVLHFDEIESFGFHGSNCFAANAAEAHAAPKLKSQSQDRSTCQLEVEFMSRPTILPSSQPLQ